MYQELEFAKVNNKEIQKKLMETIEKLRENQKNLAKKHSSNKEIVKTRKEIAWDYALCIIKVDEDIKRIILK